MQKSSNTGRLNVLRRGGPGGGKLVLGKKGFEGPHIYGAQWGGGGKFDIPPEGVRRRLRREALVLKTWAKRDRGRVRDSIGCQAGLIRGKVDS